MPASTQDTQQLSLLIVKCWVTKNNHIGNSHHDCRQSTTKAEDPDHNSNIFGWIPCTCQPTDEEQEATTERSPAATLQHVIYSPHLVHWYSHHSVHWCEHGHWIIQNLQWQVAAGTHHCKGKNIKNSGKKEGYLLAKLLKTHNIWLLLQCFIVLLVND